MRTNIPVLLTIGIVLGLLGVGIFASAAIETITKYNPEYKNAVHTYVDQAYWTNDPVAQKENLTKAVAGMHQLGLTDGMSWELFDWNQQTSESMKAQYGQMNAIIALCDKAINLNQSDVNYAFNYAQITTQIHNNICAKSGSGDSATTNWCDEVAEGAFMLNMHPWNAYMAVLVAIILIVIGILCVVLWMMFEQ
jgi:hypothetical protein